MGGGGAIVLVRFSPRCHPATVVTSKFSWTAEEDSEEEKEEGRWLTEEAGGGEKCGRKGGQQRRGAHTNDGHQKVFQRTEIKHSFLITTNYVLPSCVFYV